MKHTKETFCSYTAELDDCNDSTSRTTEDAMNAGENDALLHKLDILSARLERSKNSQRVQKCRYRRLIALLLTEFRAKENRITTHLETKHHQLTAVLRALYVLESKLKREQKHFVTLLAEKETVIEGQKAVIADQKVVIDDQKAVIGKQKVEIEKLRTRFCANGDRTISTVLPVGVKRTTNRADININNNNNNKPDLISGIADDDEKNDNSTYLISDLTACPVGTLHVRDPPKRTHERCRCCCCCNYYSLDEIESGSKSFRSRYGCRCCKVSTKISSNGGSTGSFKIKNVVIGNSNNNNNNSPVITTRYRKESPSTARLENEKRFQVYPRVPPKPKLTTTTTCSGKRRIHANVTTEELNEHVDNKSNIISSPKTSRRRKRRVRTGGNVDLQFLSEDDNKSSVEDNNSNNINQRVKIVTGKTSPPPVGSKIVRTVSTLLLLDSDNEKIVEDEVSTKVSQIVEKFERMCHCNSPACCNDKKEHLTCRNMNNNNETCIMRVEYPAKDNGNTEEDNEWNKSSEIKNASGLNELNDNDDNNNNKAVLAVDIRTNFEEFHLVDREIDVTYAKKIVVNKQVIDADDEDVIVGSINDNKNPVGSIRPEVVVENNESGTADTDYEDFLESTGLCQKSILTPSRVLSNHRNVVKPKDIKYRNRIKACGGGSHTSSNQTVKYWIEPYV